MPNLIKNLCLLSLFCFSSAAVFASTDSIFYWDDAKGLVKANNCTLTTTSKNNLSFVVLSNKFSSLKLENSDARAFLNIEHGSLVKVIDEKNEDSRSRIEIVGSVNNIKIPSWFKQNDSKNAYSVRGDVGYVNKSKIRPIENRVIQLVENAKNINAETFLKVNGDGRYLKLDCAGLDKTKNYIVFNAYSKNSDQSEYQVGVDVNDTSLFKSIKTYEKKQAYQLMPVMEADEARAINQIKLLNNDVAESDGDVDNGLDEEAELNQSNVSNNSISVVNGFDMIICTVNSTLNVRNEELDKVIFLAKKSEPVKVFQGWGNNSLEGVVGGTKYSFLKVEFQSNEGQDPRIGFVVKSFVKPRSECEYDEEHIASLKPIDTDFTGLNDKTCCIFPTVAKVTTPFTEGMRRFGASRGGGTRIHAAADLYRYKDEPIRSIAPGVVIRSLYFFYQDTFALEVLNSGGAVVRYGEMTGKIPQDVKQGKQLKMGDRVGYMGVVNSGCCDPMLHFELYSGDLKGPLTSQDTLLNGIQYNRRQDLINPTKYLLKWQNEQF